MLVIALPTATTCALEPATVVILLLIPANVAISEVTEPIAVKSAPVGPTSKAPELVLNWIVLPLRLSSAGRSKPLANS